MSERRGDQYFSSRLTMILAMLSMAVGTGNIWRFPRIVASNDGGSFIVAWVCFLLLWSVPLLIVEFAMGKHTRTGTVGAFARTMGTKYAWMGAWVAWCTIAIMFYYAVVAGWTLRFTLAAITGELASSAPGAVWGAFAYTPAAVGYQFAAMLCALLVVARGVRGIEAMTRVLLPSLVAMVVLLAIRAVTLPGAGRGLAFIFTPSIAGLTNYQTWLQALTQNAWDTGAGWGLVLTYAIYLRKEEDTALNAFVVGIGNNLVSLCAGVMVLCTIFSIMPDAAAQITGAGNEGLTFIWVPQLFQRMPLGRFLLIVFFLALFFAAWTSLISMVELAARVLQDGGMPRRTALWVVGGAGLVLGIPSALSQEVFLNQDFVWGVGLMVSGLFFALAVLRFGVSRFRTTLINHQYSSIRVGRWWEIAMYLVVAQAVVLIVWWLWQVRTEPLWGPFGVGSTLAQWAIALGLFIALNNWFVRHTPLDLPPGRPAGGAVSSIP
jgi:NSS family neurotransmitter:Na+ symporter